MSSDGGQRLIRVLVASTRMSGGAVEAGVAGDDGMGGGVLNART